MRKVELDELTDFGLVEGFNVDVDEEGARQSVRAASDVLGCGLHRRSACLFCDGDSPDFADIAGVIRLADIGKRVDVTQHASNEYGVVFGDHVVATRRFSPAIDNLCKEVKRTGLCARPQKSERRIGQR